MMDYDILRFMGRAGFPGLPGGSQDRRTRIEYYSSGF